MSERLQKRLARLGVASRRAAEGLIVAGRVTVNGQVAQLGQQVDEGDLVTVDGRALAAEAEKRTLMLYKPRGVVTTARDERGRVGVLDGLPAVAGLHPVGRLDRDSEGLLLLTTDGDLTLRLTHPRYAHEKVYRVWVQGELTDSAFDELEEGVPLEDGLSRPEGLTRAPGGLYLTLREGRKRQVRRTLAAIGFPVTRLLRVRMGGLWLGDLRAGEWRDLSARDLEDLEHPERLPRSWRLQREWQARERWG